MYKDNFLAIAILSCFSPFSRFHGPPGPLRLHVVVPIGFFFISYYEGGPPDLNFWYMDGAAFQTRLPCGGRKAGQPMERAQRSRRQERHVPLLNIAY